MHTLVSIIKFHIIIRDLRYTKFLQSGKKFHDKNLFTCIHAFSTLPKSNCYHKCTSNVIIYLIQYIQRTLIRYKKCTFTIAYLYTKRKKKIYLIGINPVSASHSHKSLHRSQAAPERIPYPWRTCRHKAYSICGYNPEESIRPLTHRRRLQ